MDAVAEHILLVSAAECRRHGLMVTAANIGVAIQRLQHPDNPTGKPARRKRVMTVKPRQPESLDLE